jgi:hypothetical protein
LDKATISTTGFCGASVSLAGSVMPVFPSPLSFLPWTEYQDIPARRNRENEKRPPSSKGRQSAEKAGLT